MKNALITGGAGFIGLNLAKLLAEKHSVTVADNFSRGKKDRKFQELLENKNVSFAKLDITEKNGFSSLGKYDYIYHLAAVNGTENFYKIPDRVIKVGVLGTLNILDWMAETKQGKLLFSSSSETYAGTLKLLGKNFPIPTPENVALSIDDPSNVRWSYGGSKIMNEISIHSYSHLHGMDFSIIRYHNIYGPRMGEEHVIPQLTERILKKENPFKLFGAENTRTFCHVEDAVKATQLVMESAKTSKQTVHIGRTDGEISILDLAKKLFKIAGYNPKIVEEPSPKGSVMRRCPDTKKLKSLGFKANISLDEGLKETFEWYKEFYSSQK